MQAKQPINPEARLCGRREARVAVLRGRREHVLVLDGREPQACAREINAWQREGALTLIAGFAFGGASQADALLGTLEGDCPMVFLQGDAATRTSPFTSVQVQALTGVEVQEVRGAGGGRGSVYEDEGARYCRLSGIVPRDLAASRGRQVQDVFEMAEQLLGEAGFAFTDTIRTWFYLDHLLEWYGTFNEVRTEFFRTRGVFGKRVPASTGIGAANLAGAALSCDLLAMVPKTSAVTAEAVSSPLQDSALHYRSSFSRAVELKMGGHRQLLISGTASIDQAGKTVHEGDPAAQVDLTLRVVEALLNSRGMGWAHATRGIAYFKRLADRPLMERWLAAHQVPEFPLAIMEADICRHDLDFELELDALA